MDFGIIAFTELEKTMARVDGNWDLLIKTPVGDMKSAMTIKSAGDTVNGSNVGDMGSSEFTGTIEGDTLHWKMDVTVPMRMTLDCTAFIEGDTLTGSVIAGAMGRFPSMTGTRVV